MKPKMMAPFFFAALSLAVEAKTVNVFFAGGQSNAKAEWASAIASGLQAGYGSSLVMVYTNHSGQAMANWFTTAPQINYSNDLWNTSGTGLLQSQIRAITNAGDQAVFRGFFWFQGESDTGSNTAAYAVMDAYTNRFTDMLSQLKTDLGMTNDVRFCLAVIDADPNPDYDDDLADGGRDRACIEYLRNNQVFLGSMPTGSYVDTRGYTRTDLWHLTTSELARLGTAMSGAYTNKFGIAPPLEGEIDIFSPDADGAIYPTGVFSAQDLVCGSGGTPNTTPFNGIAFFRLPAYRIASADLSLTVEILYGSWPTAGANLDVWGLGYMTAPLMDKGWLLQADADSRVLLNFRAPTKIAENFVTSSQVPVVNSVLQLSASQRTSLTSFLNGLYDQGAQPGDYAVIRVNQDAVITAGGVSVRFGGSHRTSPDHRPKLTVSLSDTNATAQAFVHYSSGADGAVNATAATTTLDLISGTGGTQPVDFSGIAFLPLPEQPMTSVSLALTAAVITGVLSNANVDVWGLGYMTTPNMSTTWICTNDTDTRAFSVGTPVKLADNIVTTGQTVSVGTVWVPTVSQEKTLVRYLNGLYNLGAKPGDFAVIRVNMDSTEAGYSRGVRWGGSHRTVPDWRPRLAGTYISASNYLKNASFEFGSGNVVSNWGIAYGNFLGQRTNDSIRCGSYAFRMAVNGDQSTNAINNLNLAQEVYSPDFAGKVVTFCGHARHNTIEPLVSNSVQKVEFRIYWLGVPGTPFITSSDSYNLLPADLKDVYKPVFISGLAPTNATGVRAQVIFRSGTTTNPSITNGAAIVDDVRLSVFDPVFPEGTLIRVW